MLNTLSKCHSNLSPFQLGSSRAVQINKFFENNAVANKGQLLDHIGKADIVPIDYRVLNNINQAMVSDWIKGLSLEQKSKILILR